MRLYHASLIPDLTTLIPKTPSHFLTKHLLEEGITKRVCFAPSIKSCLRAIDAKKNKIYYIYQPNGINEKYLYKPSREEVPDVSLTHEIWYLKPVSVRLVAVVVAGEVINTKVFYMGPVFGLSHGHSYEVKKRFKNGKEIKPRQKKEIELEEKSPSFWKRISNKFFKRNK